MKKWLNAVPTVLPNGLELNSFCPEAVFLPWLGLLQSVQNPFHPEKGMWRLLRVHARTNVCTHSLHRHPGACSHTWAHRCMRHVPVHSQCQQVHMQKHNPTHVHIQLSAHTLLQCTYVHGYTVATHVCTHMHHRAYLLSPLRTPMCLCGYKCHL